MAVLDFLHRAQRVIPATSCVEEGKDVDGILQDERCADHGPFQGRFLLQELISLIPSFFLIVQLKDT